MTKVQDNERDRMIAGAVRYAQADRSDPFTFARAMAQIKNGICGHRSEPCTMYGRLHSPAIGPAYFNADSKRESRKIDDHIFSDGTDTFFITTYRNLVRP